MTPRHIVLLGGTCFVGRALCAELVSRAGAGGLRLVVPTRRLAHGRAVQCLPGVELAVADVHDDTQLARVLAGAHAVVNLVAILQGNEAAFARVHAELPRRVAAACHRAGVARIVHVSALGVASDAPSRYLRSKAAGEQVLRESGLAATLLRPSVIFGAEDRLLNLFARLQAVAPFVPLAGASSRFQPVWVQDVASAIATCLERPDTAGQTFECAGPEVLTLAELVRLAGRLAGHERPIFALPDALARLQAMLMEWLPGEPLMSRDNLDSMKVPNVSTGRLPGLAQLGISPAPLQAVAPAYLAPGQGPSRLVRWRAHQR
ncbi:MAG: complex I NDUFA9 subunit family protein [Rubrivivax sp.]